MQKAPKKYTDLVGSLAYSAIIDEYLIITGLIKHNRDWTFVVHLFESGESQRHAADMLRRFEDGRWLKIGDPRIPLTPK